MSNLKPTIGLKFEDKYADARQKLIDFSAAFNNLTYAQKEQLAREFAASTGMGALLEQWIRCMNTGGRL